MEILTSFRDLASKNLIPLQATLELTYRCNERCGHCYLSTYDDYSIEGKTPLSKDQWFHVIDQLEKAGALLLILIGGEAMLHPDFWQIAEYGAKKNFAISLITNGLLINDLAVEKMLKIGFYNVTVSLYSLHPHIHDQMTNRKGSHQKTIDAIYRLKKNNISVGINCLLTRNNIESYFELEDWAKLHHIPISHDALVTAKNDDSPESLLERASLQQLKKFYATQSLRGQTFRASQDTLDNEDPICNAGRGKCAVNAYGELLTCLEVKESLGSLIKNDFQTLWHSPIAEKIRNKKNSQIQWNQSKNCGAEKFCDHCPGMAAAETGNALSPVPYLVEIAKIKNELSQKKAPNL